MRELVLKGSDENERALHYSASDSEARWAYSSNAGRINLAQKIHEWSTRGMKFYSLEFFPQEYVRLTETLVSSVGASEPPLFCSVTWHVDTPLTASPPDIPALRLGGALAEFCPAVLHLAARGLTAADVHGVLRHALQQGITSVLLLRGDGVEERRGASFLHAVDLVRYVRRDFGDQFTVFVAGYPDRHPEAASYQQDLRHLKDKVDAGADGIITQVVFDAQKFASFVRDCRHIGINVPILPGVMPILSYKSLERASRICKFSIPHKISDDLRPIAEDDEAVQEYGLCHAAQLVRELFSLGCVHGIHFFTLNRPQLAVSIWQRAGASATISSGLSPRDSNNSCLPSQHSPNS